MSQKAAARHSSEIGHSVVIPGDRVVRSQDVVQIGARSMAKHDGPASVELISEGDVVKAIDVTCSCGQKIRLWCSYEPKSEGQ